MLALVNTPNGEELTEIREVEEPEAAPEEAIVEVRAFSLNRGELKLLESRPEGWRPGQDVAGVVLHRAADGSGPAEGARVVGLLDGNGWAQRVAAPTSRLAVLPDGVDFAEAAALPVAGLTALRALRIGGSLLGRRVLVTGASGGVGRFAVQLAAYGGARVTGVVGSPERGEGLRELGATEVVTGVEDLERPFDLILESAGGPSLTAALRLVAPDGTVVMFGNSSGEDSSVSFGSIFGSPRAKLYAFFVFESEDHKTFREDLALLASLVAEGNLTPQIGAEASWQDLGHIATALRERRVAGKAVFRIE